MEIVAYKDDPLDGDHLSEGESSSLPSKISLGCSDTLVAFGKRSAATDPM
jgi:hypothetical protein